ncbi:hypothetical protein OSB04_016046 [Centaurea solstitialis]|uniref:Uncharacterized protein n=1 Tax=Centaurea solstitialis TaxID=347529 RepID=A0AA38TDF8_9ASTR|nr:hypothetical protein OSB04_016046 [Centaurea solstitialis]
MEWSVSTRKNKKAGKSVIRSVHGSRSSSSTSDFSGGKSRPKSGLRHYDGALKQGPRYTQLQALSYSGDFSDRLSAPDSGFAAGRKRIEPAGSLAWVQGEGSQRSDRKFVFFILPSAILSNLSPSLKGGKKMEPNPRSFIYDMAKIEEPNLRLPKSLLKPGSDPTDDLTYLKIFEEDGRRSQHLAEAVAAGAQADRKVYRIRNKDVRDETTIMSDPNAIGKYTGLMCLMIGVLLMFYSQLVRCLGKDHEVILNIHRVSKATIGLLADSESNLHQHSYLDLVGTVEEVRAAEELILDEILKGYDSLVFPVILMPPTVHHQRMRIPFEKVPPLIGEYGGNLLRMEIVSASWIAIDLKCPPEGSPNPNWEQFADIYGPRPNVIKAMLEIQAAISEPWDVVEALEKIRQEFEEIVIVDETENKEAGVIEKGKQLKAEECGGSGTVKEKQEKADDGETEKETKEKDEADDELKDERREDVEAASEHKESGESETEEESDKRTDIVTLDLFR